MKLKLYRLTNSTLLVLVTPFLYIILHHPSHTLRPYVLLPWPIYNSLLRTRHLARSNYPRLGLINRVQLYIFIGA
jgi:hypothetical protein